MRQNKEKCADHFFEGFETPSQNTCAFVLNLQYCAKRAFTYTYPDSLPPNRTVKRSDVSTAA